MNLWSRALLDFKNIMDWQIRLISIFLFITENFNGKLQFYVLRYRNNSSPVFTDEEVITILTKGISKVWQTSLGLEPNFSSIAILCTAGYL
jgi:hypothetical protein